MEYEEVGIEGCYVLRREAYADDRGEFLRLLDIDELKQLTGVALEIKHLNSCTNTEKYTLRGMHSQRFPKREIKVVSVLKGSVFDVAIDIRKGSRTYLKWFGIELSMYNKVGLLVPEGCLHGYLTLEPNSIVVYGMSSGYEPDLEEGYRYDDPAFGVTWPEKPLLVSKKDLGFKPYGDG